MFPPQSDFTPLPNTAQQSRAAPPVLFVDVDGVISLFGFDAHDTIPGRFYSIDGILHCIGSSCGSLLGSLRDRFELVWASGWEEKANEYLPHLLELPKLPTLTFDGRARFGTAHWKLEAIDEYAGDRPAAWIDDSLDETCERWAASRRSPTLLVRTDPEIGIERRHVEELVRFADFVTAQRRRP
jgi:hypothetical protein